MPSNIRGSDNFDSGHDLGVGQTWQDMTASRTADTNYTNNTGKPIEISIIFTLTQSATLTKIVIDGISVEEYSNSNSSLVRVSASKIVPPNSVYSFVEGAGTLEKWAKLRGV